MAVTDIAEALTVSDRPYKKQCTWKLFIEFLDSWRKMENPTTDMVELFLNQEIYKIYQEKHETSAAKS